MTTTQRVQSILEYSKASRNSDKELWIIYAQKSGLDLNARQIEVIRNMPEFETIRRVRQQIQHDGMYEADPKVQEQRKQKGEMIRDAFGAHDNDLAVELMNKPTPDWLEGIAGIV